MKDSEDVESFAPKGEDYRAVQDLKRLLCYVFFSRNHYVDPHGSDPYGLDLHVASKPEQPERPEHLDSERQIIGLNAEHYGSHRHPRSAARLTEPASNHADWKLLRKCCNNYSSPLRCRLMIIGDSVHNDAKLLQCV